MEKMNNKEKGNLGEEIAAKYLEKEGYKILQRNYRFSKNAEIDIIAMDKTTLVFVEVKTRTNLNSGHPFEAIDNNKLQKIQTAVYGFLSQTKEKFNGYRCDGIAVIGLDNPKIEHLKNIYFG